MSVKTCFSVNKYNVKLWRSGNKIRTNATKKTVQPPECSSGGTGSAPLHIVRLHHQLFSLPSPCLLARHFTLFFTSLVRTFFLTGGTCFLDIFSPGHVCGRRASFHMELVHQSRLARHFNKTSAACKASGKQVFSAARINVIAPHAGIKDSQDLRRERYF